jgi:hypothetical protein
MFVVVVVMQRAAAAVVVVIQRAAASLFASYDDSTFAQALQIINRRNLTTIMSAVCHV